MFAMEVSTSPPSAVSLLRITADRDGVGSPILLRLKNGGVLSYRVYGRPLAQAPAGVVVYFHGFWSSSMEGAIAHEGAVQHGVSVVAFDRCGYSKSAEAASPSVDYVSQCVEELLDSLKVQSALLLGVSCGALYASACAARLGSRARALALVVPLAPLELPPETGWRGLLRRPAIVRAQLWAARLACRLIPVAAMLQLAGFPEVDKEATRFCERDTDAMHAAREAGLEPGIEGPWADLQVMVRGRHQLRLEHINCRALVWGAEQDHLTPAWMAASYAEDIKACSLRLVPDAGHLSLPFHLKREIMGALLGCAGEVSGLEEGLGKNEGMEGEGGGSS